MKKIWIVNYYTETPEMATNLRYLYFAKHFMEAGYEVVTFNSSVSTNLSSEAFQGQSFLKKQYGEYQFVHIKVPEYQGNGLKRMLSIWAFAHAIYKSRKHFERPDIILQNIHPPFDYPIVRLAKKMKAKYIAEAWDLWPENFITFGLISERNPAMKMAYQIEKKYYYHADELVFTFKGAADYLKKKGWTTETGGEVDLEHVHYVNNGVDLNLFEQNKKKYPRPDADINNPDIYKIVYLGSINRANNVRILVEAAAILRENHRYKFFIYGDGTYREELEQYVRSRGLTNVVFKEKYVPFAECAWIVSQATINVMNYEQGFGIHGVSPGKLFLYLAAGKPIVCNVSIAYDDVITNHNLGVAKDIICAEDYVEEIRKLAEQPKVEYEAMCQRVCQVAKEFDYEQLAERELKIIE